MYLYMYTYTYIYIYIYIYIRVASEPRRGSGGQGIIARAIPTWPRPRTIVLFLDCSLIFLEHVRPRETIDLVRREWG